MRRLSPVHWLLTLFFLKTHIYLFLFCVIVVAGLRTHACVCVCVCDKWTCGHMSPTAQISFRMELTLSDLQDKCVHLLSHLTGSGFSVLSDLQAHSIPVAPAHSVSTSHASVLSPVIRSLELSIFSKRVSSYYCLCVCQCLAIRFGSLSLKFLSCCGTSPPCVWQSREPSWSCMA